MLLHYYTAVQQLLLIVPKHSSAAFVGRDQPTTFRQMIDAQLLRGLDLNLLIARYNVQRTTMGKIEITLRSIKLLTSNIFLWLRQRGGQKIGPYLYRETGKGLGSTTIFG